MIQPAYYSQSVTVRRSPSYRKKRWVPNWLWRLVAEPDIISLVESKLGKAMEDMETDISS